MSNEFQGYFQKEESRWYQSREFPLELITKEEKDDVFPEILFTITEAWERDEGNKKGAGKDTVMNRALREPGGGEHRTGRL